MWNGSVWVTTTVGTSPMCRVSGRDPGGDQHRVEPAADLVGAVVGARRSRSDWSAEGVLDGDEVEQAALGLGDQVGPVAGGEQLGGPGVRLAPGGRVPAGAVQRDGEVAGRTLPCPAQPAAPAADSAFTASIRAGRATLARRARRPVAARSAPTTLPPSADSAGHSAAARIATRRGHLAAEADPAVRVRAAERPRPGDVFRSTLHADEHVSRQLRRSRRVVERGRHLVPWKGRAPGPAGVRRGGTAPPRHDRQEPQPCARTSVLVTLAAAAVAVGLAVPALAPARPHRATDGRRGQPADPGSRSSTGTGG